MICKVCDGLNIDENYGRYCSVACFIVGWVSFYINEWRWDWRNHRSNTFFGWFNPRLYQIKLFHILYSSNHLNGFELFLNKLVKDSGLYSYLLMRKGWQ